MREKIHRQVLLGHFVGHVGREQPGRQLDQFNGDALAGATVAPQGFAASPRHEVEGRGAPLEKAFGSEPVGRGPVRRVLVCPVEIEKHPLAVLEAMPAPDEAFPSPVRR